MPNLDPATRRAVARLAAELYDLQLSYPEFLAALPTIDTNADDAVTEFLGLIEHQPARGRVLGLAPPEYEDFVADIRRRIAKLAS